MENGLVFQDCILKSRKELSISGVKEILSFDDTAVNLQTVMGGLAVRGENLKILFFNTEKEEAGLIGKINAVYYTDDNSGKESFFKKLFK